MTFYMVCQFIDILNLILAPVPHPPPKWPTVRAMEMHLQHLVVLLE